MQISFVDLKSQYLSIKDEIDSAIQKVIRDSSFIGSKYVESFEQNFSNYCGAKHGRIKGNKGDAHNYLDIF